MSKNAKNETPVADEQPQSASRPPEKISRKYKVKKTVTVPMRKLNNGDEIAATLTGDFRVMLLEAGNNKKSPALIARMVNMATGVEEDLVCSTVLTSTLSRESGVSLSDKVVDDMADKTFKVDQLAGHCYLFECKKRPDKNYYDVFVSEIEMED